MSFTAKISCSEQLDNGEYTTKRVDVSSQTFENLAEAIKYAEMEAHGLHGADWYVTARLSFKKACATVAASRNRRLFVFINMDALDPAGDNMRLAQTIELKAPQICKILHEMEKRVDPAQHDPEACKVRFLLTKDHMIVG